MTCAANPIGESAHAGHDIWCWCIYMFYLAGGELEGMNKNALAVVQEARAFVKSHKRDD